MSTTPSRSKKAPTKRSASPAGTTPKSKSKRPGTPVTSAVTTLQTEGDTVNSNASSPAAPSESNTENKIQYVFKDPNFVHSTKAAGNKRIRIWKNLKQICAAERGLTWNDNDVTYSSIDAPPSFSPAKKYSDITGLPAKYTDPQTKIRYATIEEFQRIRMLPSDLVTGYLTLRKATIAVP